MSPIRIHGVPLSRLRRERRRWGALLLAATVVGAEVLGAGPPRVDRLFPAGGQRGTQVTLVADGLLEPWPVKVWSDAPGLVFKPLNATNQYEVNIASTTPEGAHLIRFYSDEGSSEPALFIVGSFPEQTQPPQDGDPQPDIRVDQFPLTYNGRVRDPAQLPSFLLVLQSECVVQARLDAEGFDSPLRAGLVLLDSDDRQVGASDVSEREPVVRLRCAVSRAGTYRLRLTKPGSPRPVGGVAPRAGAEAGYRLGLATEQSVAPITTERPGGSSGGEIQRAFQAVQPLVMPSLVHGRISHAGGERRFGFSARAQEEFYLRVRSVGALDPQVRIRDEAGNVIWTADRSMNGEVSWVAPGDGVYSIVVNDTQGRGGPDFGFELEAGVPVPHWVMTSETHAVRVVPGEKMTFAVRISRPQSDRGVLSLVPTGLPEDVVAAPGPVPPGGGVVNVELSAAVGAKPCSQPFQILLMAVPATVPHFVSAKAPVRGRFAAPGRLLINEIDQLWLTMGEPRK